MRKPLFFILTIFLIFLPLQSGVLRLIFLEKFQYIDELFSVLFFVIFLLYLLVSLKIKKKLFKIGIVLLFFCVLGFVSGIINSNRIIVTILGTFDYVKNFVFLFLLGSLSVDHKLVIKLYKIISKFSIFLCLIVIFILFAHMLEIELPKVTGEVIELRFGLPRIAPLNIHPNMLGLYSLLFFILDFGISYKINFKKLLLLVGIFFSVSRMVWMSFILSILFLFFQLKVRNRVVYGLLFFILFGVIVLPKVIKKTQIEYLSESYYRGYVLKKYLEIYKDHPILGVGPGMYGGVISVKFNSPIYEKYNFSKHWYDFGLKNFHSLDMFWPQILVECGLIGTLLFMYFLFLLHKIAKQHYKNSNIDFVRRFSLGLSVIPMVIFFYLFGSGLNLAPFLVTYSVFLGMCLGVKKQNESSTYK